MKTEVGLWIDHRQAVIVTTPDPTGEVKRILSNMEKRVRYSGSARPTGGKNEPHHISSEDGRDRRYDDRLNRYYDQVITELGEATSILILGPGEAKIELQKRLEGQESKHPVVAVQAADKLTNEQIVAEVHQYFQGDRHTSDSPVAHKQDA